ncbi:6-phosphofructo-2-kinase/fructose-2,6-bisphosphatase-like protein isoform X1 [Tanacetum coccineum]
MGALCNIFERVFYRNESGWVELKHLSGKGELDAKKLANFVKKRFQNERAALVWTSTLQRTNLTTNLIARFPKVQWRALDEINASYVMSNTDFHDAICRCHYTQ